MHRAGLVSKVSDDLVLVSMSLICNLFYRCDAKWDNLDDNIAGRRSHKLTCSLVEALDKNSLWDDYGIISDIMVCFSH
jgi:hypothetical protein